MNRRELLKFLPTAGAAAMIPAIADQKPLSDQKDAHPDWGVHGDWFYRWSGWIQLPTQDVMVGHWVAKRPADPFSFGIYSSYPGITSKFVSGQIFDTHVEHWQEIPGADTTPQKLEEFKMEAFCRLIEYIEKYDKELRRP